MHSDFQQRSEGKRIGNSEKRHRKCNVKRYEDHIFPIDSRLRTTSTTMFAMQILSTDSPSIRAGSETDKTIGKSKTNPARGLNGGMN